VLIDSHCHLDDDRFDADRDEVMRRAREVGIEKLVIPATTAVRWPKVADVASQYPGVFASYGLHPMFMGEHHAEADLAALDAWLDAHDAVALGECGLDFYQGNDDEQEQLALFRTQLDIAANHSLPVIIHARKALDRIIAELRRSGVRSGAIHSFSGSLQQAEQLADLGFKLGIAATVGYERAKKLREVVRQIDGAALLIETDAPDQPGPAHRGERNEPAYLTEHLQTMAELRQLAVDQLATLLSDNCRELFSI
jgi:TatD DNase family protein